MANVIAILEELEKKTGSMHFAEYTYTDISPAFFESAPAKFASINKRLKYRKLDIEKDPAFEGFQLGSYDLFICGSVLHATADLKRTLFNL